MSDEEDPKDDNPTGEGIESSPPSNPETDQDAVDKGIEQLERVKPY